MTTITISKEWIYEFGKKTNVKKVDLDRMTETDSGPYVTNMTRYEKTDRENGNGTGRFIAIIDSIEVEVATW